MKYLDFERLEAIHEVAYQATRPYPWVNLEGLLYPEAYEALYVNLPDVSLLDHFFGKQRKAGQESHDRYQLEYRDETPVPGPWREFIEELKGDRYRRSMSRLLGADKLSINFHWHYTPRACSVSPHCDSWRKLGSHIFYFNSERDWDERWGGQTVVLEDHGRFETASAPAFEDFDEAIESKAMGNVSFLFSRRGNSWHGVRAIDCPDPAMRKVFIVVLNDYGWLARFRTWIQGKDLQRY